MLNPSFKDSIYIYRKNMTPAGRSRSKNAIVPVFGYPAAVESRYRKELFNIFSDLQKFAIDTLLNNLDRWIDEGRLDSVVFKSIMDCYLEKDDLKSTALERLDDYIHNSKYSKVEQDRFDDWMDELNGLLNRLNRKINDVFGIEGEPPEISPVYIILGGLAAATLAHGERQWKKVSEKFSGTTYTTDRSWWPEVRKRWERENYVLMRRYGRDYIDQLNETVFRGVRNGASGATIRNEIRGLGRKTKMKLKYLARDQIGKLNGKITEQLYSEAGVNTYTWLTSQDERVRGLPSGKYPKARPRHDIMNGMICRWDDASVYADPATDVDKNGKVIKWRKRTGAMPKVHPGEAILCRCTAIARMADILSEVDEEIVA